MWRRPDGVSDRGGKVMKRLLVTGASGFLGSRIIEYYRDRYEICAPSHTDMDITDKEKVAAVFRDVRKRAGAVVED